MTDAGADDVVVVLCTVPPDPEVAGALAKELVIRRLAACVNVLPAVRSIYRWKDGVEDEGEALLIIKAPARRVPEVSAYLTEAHPYDVPEVIALPVVGGLEAYLSWVRVSSEPEHDR